MLRKCDLNMKGCVRFGYQEVVALEQVAGYARWKVLDSNIKHKLGATKFPKENSW